MRRPSLRAAALAVAGLLAASGAVTLGAALVGRDAGRPVAASVVAPAAAETPPAASAPQPTQVARSTIGSSVRLTLPEVGLDLPVLPLEPSGGAINPPTMHEAYWVQPYGDPVGEAAQAANTLYIAAHSWNRGDAAFNPLLDTAQQRGAVEPGDVVSVHTPEGTVDYTVERTKRYAKDALAGADEVWEIAPGRLVLITCLQRSDGRTSTENFVVFAES